MKEYAILAIYKPLKGFFKQKVAGEYLLVAVKVNGMALVFQFLDKYKDYYVVALEMGVQSPDDEALEELFDQLRYNANVNIIEDKLKVKEKRGSGKLIYEFSPNSKYIGNKLTLLSDSRLPRGYYFSDAKIKKGFEPAVIYRKISDGALDLSDAKKIRAFTEKGLRQILKQK
jgi:hypothetical protein